MAKRDWYCEDVLSGNLDVQSVYEDDRVLAFHHPSPVAEIHVVVVPRTMSSRYWMTPPWTVTSCHP